MGKCDEFCACARPWCVGQQCRSKAFAVMGAFTAGKTRIYTWSVMSGSGPGMARGHSHLNVAITVHGTQLCVPSFACPPRARLETSNSSTNSRIRPEAAAAPSTVSRRSMLAGGRSRHSCMLLSSRSSTMPMHHYTMPNASAWSTIYCSSHVPFKLTQFLPS